MMPVHTLSIPGVIDQVPYACDWVVKIAEETGMDMRGVNHCELAVDEAITNIIEHGYGNDGAQHIIDIIVDELPNQLTITIVDDGPPYDPLDHTDPDPLMALDDRPENGGGWGVFFIKKVMDGVDYKYLAKRNHLTMVKEKS